MFRNFKRIASFLLLVSFIIMSLGACSGAGGNNDKETDDTSGAGAKTDEIINLELTVFNQWGEAYVPPEQDLVGKAIEANTNYRIKVKEVFFEKQGNWTEEFNLFAAANNFPDVCVFPSSGIDTVAKFSNYFYDLKDYITDAGKTPNMHKYHTDSMINSLHKYKTLDGKYLGWPLDVFTPDFSDASLQEQYDILYHNRKSRNDGAVIFAREDILKEVGYSFTPVNDLIAKVESDNQWLSVNDFKLDPPVDTIEQFEELLRKVKNANLKSKDGKPVIPLSGSDVSFNFGGIFAFDFFRKFPDGSIHSYYGSPYAKDFFKTVNNWYREGLFDKDIYLLKGDQKVQKIVNGEVALWTSVGANDEIQKNLLEKYPEAYVRPIPLPTYKDVVTPATEDSQPGPGQSLAINKNFKKLDELIGYLDWLYSDKGQELSLWGDGQGIIWEEKDGKKVFLDDKMYEACLVYPFQKMQASDGKSPSYYGLAHSSPYTAFFNKNTWMNPYYYKYSYPNKLIGSLEVIRAAGENGIDMTGKYVNAIPQGEYAARANNFFWAQSWDWSAKMFLSKTDEEFEKNWKTVYDMFMKEVGDYEQLQKDMASAFRP